MVRQAMAAFNARAENYPELRSQENMLQFQERISDVESQISDRREV
jgi:LemA protein